MSNFKVGQKVKFIGKAEDLEDINCNIKEGDVGEILDIERSFNYPIKVEFKKDNIYYTEYFKEVELEEIDKIYSILEFKEGVQYRKLLDNGKESRYIYKIENKKLYYRFDNKEKNEFEESKMSYNELIDTKYVRYEEKKEIDWSKVPRGTKVQVRDFDGDFWYNRYYYGFDKDSEYPYCTTKRIDDDEFTGDTAKNTLTGYQEIRIYDTADIKESWYKED